MIKTEKEYKNAQKKITEDIDFIAKQKDKLKELGLTEEQINIAMEPTYSFHEQLKDEVLYYEKIKRGEFSSLYNFYDMGRYLIGLRIYKGLTQKQLAKKLEVSEAQVSKDEKNEYHGVSIEKIQRILNAMEVCIEAKYKEIAQNTWRL